MIAKMVDARVAMTDHYPTALRLSYGFQDNVQKLFHSCLRKFKDPNNSETNGFNIDNYYLVR